MSTKNHNSVVYTGTAAERGTMSLVGIKQGTEWMETDTSQIWEVWDGSWRIAYPPPGLSAPDGDPNLVWSVNNDGDLVGDNQDGGASPKLIFYDDDYAQQVEMWYNADESKFYIDFPDTTYIAIRNAADAERIRLHTSGEVEQIYESPGTNDVVNIHKYTRTTTNTAAAGFGLATSWRLENDGTAIEEAAYLQVEWESAVDGAEDSQVSFLLRKGGAALAEFVKFAASETVFNETGVDVDFRVEGVGEANALFVQGSNGFVGIGTNMPAEMLDVAGDLAIDETLWFMDGAVRKRHITLSGNGQDLQFGTTGIGSGIRFKIVAAVGVVVGSGSPTPDLPILTARRASSSFDTNSDMIAMVRATTGIAAAGLGGGYLFYLENATGDEEPAARFSAVWSNAGDGTESAYFTFQTRNAGGTVLERMRITSAGTVLINGFGSTAVGQIIKGAAAQTANLLELQESDGSIMLSSGDGLGGSEFAGNVQLEDIDFSWSGDTIADLLKVNAGNDEVEVNGSFFVAQELSATPDEVTATDAGVAASILTVNTEVTTNGDTDLDNVTLANGKSGQIKHIYCVVEGNAGDTWKITPATMIGGTQITFSGIGQGCTMVYADNEGWCIVANNGGTIT